MLGKIDAEVGAPRTMSSRLTVRAKPSDFIFFLTLEAVYVADAAGGAHQGGRRDEAGQLVARIEPPCPSNAPAGNRADNRRASKSHKLPRRNKGCGTQDGRSLQRMIRRIGPAFVIEVVQESDDAPGFLVAERPDKVHGDLDRMRATRLTFDVFVQQGEGVSCESWSSFPACFA